MYIINTYFISTHVLTFYKYSQLSKIISVSAAKNILYRLSHYANIMYKKSQNFTKQLPYIIHIYILYIDIALHKDLLKIWHIRKKNMKLHIYNNQYCYWYMKYETTYKFALKICLDKIIQKYDQFWPSYFKDN